SSASDPYREIARGILRANAGGETVSPKVDRPPAPLDPPLRV
ncbi:MAG: hypothetical protein H6Q84_1412, partial [Deltaproteobacteria bacterium]|nr:hypothetical protein [Deltaproteobacteria bacterium]